MARKDALLKLHSRLTTRRRELFGTIEEQLVSLRTEQGQASGDELDVAAISMNSELTSQLAEHESRELMSIERALHRLREGTYGNCEVCDKKIPIERLNILPYTTVCVTCQRELETNPELREELEQRHERELASLGEEDDEPREFQSDEEPEPVAEEPEEENRRAKRRAALEAAPAAAAKPAVGKVPAKPLPPVKTPGKPAPMTKPSAVSKTIAKPVVKAKPAPPAKPTKSVPVKATTKPAAKALAKTPVKTSAKAGSAKSSAVKPSSKPVAKTSTKSATLAKAPVGRRTSATTKPAGKVASKAKPKTKVTGRGR